MRSTFEEELRQIEEHYDSGEIAKEIDSLRKRLLCRPLILFGVAQMGIANARFCAQNGIPVTCFCDSKMSGVEKEFQLPIVSPKQMRKDYPDANIVICSATYYDEIYILCRGLGIDDENIIKEFPQQLGRISMEEFRSHIDGHKWAYDFFDDEISKEIIIARIKGMLFGSPMKQSSSRQYFERDLVKLSDEEILLDAGAYTGDTVEDFMQYVNHRYKHIYCFEPDDINRRVLTDKFGHFSDITIIPKGLWNTETTLKFAQNGSGGSCVNESGMVSVDVTSVDLFFSDKPLREYPTYIKMDVEGSEKELLLGAKQVITAAHPKLAVCVYHKPEDIYELTRLVYGYSTEYKMSLRHYTRNVFDTVLYAL